MIAGVLCGASVLSLVLSLVMPPISQAIANDAQPVSTEKNMMGEGSSSKFTDVDDTTNGDTKHQNSDDAEGDETDDDAFEADPLSDDTEAEGAAQPVDDGQSVYKAATVANEGEAQGLQKDADDYTLLTSDNDLTIYLAMQNKPEKLRLTADISSTVPITIRQNTTIDLAGNKLYFSNGNNNKNDKDCTFIKIENDATLTVKGAATDVASDAPSSEPGQVAKMQWSESTPSTPQSLTYYVTESTSTPNGLGTSEKTYQHTVTNFGAIVACKEGHVNQVISVGEGCTLNLSGGMITTPRTLGNDGHVIFSQGTVNISGGYVTNGNGGGWGGGLCVTGTNAKFNMTGGVIAANKAASGGGIYADQGATLNLSGGVISGNATYEDLYNDIDNPNNGYGGGVFTKNADVTINGTANITNNRVDSYIDTKYNNGLLGGGGIASVNGGKLTMAGGSVTANYSHEAGGGIYAGFHNQPITTFSMTGGFIAGNMSDNAEGGGLRISSGTTGVIEAAGASSKVYITNNKTMTGKSRGGDWGGGGVFVQTYGTLNLRAALVTNNEAGGWGGGIGACPTGKTIVTHTNGSAIYSNIDHGDHFSAGGNDKNEDSQSKYITEKFKTAGHQDFFLVRNKDTASSTIAVVLGKMLGGESAGWHGTCDGEEITIDPNGGAEAKYMFGLEAHPSDQAIKDAKKAATTIISGNYSYTHGGGIMTNGDLIVGDDNEGLDVYPNMKLIASKVLKDANGGSLSLNGHNYKFKLLRQVGTTVPSWKADGTLDEGSCSAVGEATVSADGSITFDSGKDYSSGQYVFYLVEEPVSGANELDTRFDKTIYKIAVTVGNSPDRTEYLMKIPIKYYTVEGVAVYKKAETDSGFAQLNAGRYSFAPSEDRTEATVTIGKGSANPTFTNEIVPYTSSGSWTPKATKVVKGGEMKEFTLEFADNEQFEGDSVRTVKTDATRGATQLLSFLNDSNEGIKYSLSDITKVPYTAGDSTGRGASKTFTYYVHEKDESSPLSHYKYDKSVYRFDVTMADQKDGRIVPTNVTYTQIKDADGKEIDSNKQVPFNFDGTKPESTPTFTNTYSTSLPLSGMSGVTLTYLAGAAVLCAAAAWMHIRRKANAKGGERRE